jgi:UDP-4-amino-4,6-dideoxy-L-N-acetyl-beta-L-altrosamine transaminase
VLKKFLPYGCQSISKDDIAAVTAALSEEIITRGRHVEAFERALAERCDVTYAIAFNSGTAALQAAYFAGGISAHDRVYTTPNSFFATAGAALLSDARIIFIDIDRTSGNIDIEQLIANINTPYTRGRTFVTPVHFAGKPVDMERLQKSISVAETIVIEDAAHALGSYYRDGSPVGSCRFSDMTIFSFHPVKTITSGEGGAVTTNDEGLYHQLRRFRNNGIERQIARLEDKTPMPWYYEVQAATGNYNLTDFQAALALSQLKRLDLFASKRRALVRRYRQRLKGQPRIKLFSAEDDERMAPHLFVVQIDFAACGTTRVQVMDKLEAAGIGTQVHYIPIYRHPVMRRMMGELAEYFPVMEGYYECALSLPLFYDLQLEEVDGICDLLLKILHRRK